ncbi:hypothetical protein [Afipia sp. P52-10]|nr:hypothetical protein [Afipia sp. P52-10]
MSALSLCRARLEALQKRIERWQTLTAYSSLSFMALILIVTLPHRIF